MEQVFWAKNTMIKITIPLLCGMILANYIYINILWIIIVVILFAALYYILFFKQNIKWFQRFFYLKAILLCTFFGALGFVRFQLNQPLFNKSDLMNIQNSQCLKYIQLNDKSANPKTWYATILVYKTYDKEVSFSYQTFIKFNDTQRNYLLKPNCIIPVKSSFYLIDSHTSANKFYKFLKNKNIHFNATIYPSAFDTIFYPKEKFTWKGYIEHIQQKINLVFQKYIKDKNAIGLAQALLYGYRKDIDKSLINAYSQTGIIHIIAVSGMHVSLVYSIMFFLWNFMSRYLKSRFFHHLKLILFTCGIWFFANVSGFAPSILRATIVFTIVLFGEHSKQNSQSYNNLAFAALLILWIQPLHIFDLGFQLSFLAVLGIQIITPMIVHLFYFKNLILKSIWQSIVICLSAQIATTPLTIYYFSQFPTLFIFTNLIAVFLSSIILYLEFALLFFCFIPVFADYLGFLINFLINFLNTIILYFQKLPHVIVEGISFSLPTVFSLYWTFIIFVYYKIKTQKKNLL